MTTRTLPAPASCAGGIAQLQASLQTRADTHRSAQPEATPGESLPWREGLGLVGVLIASIVPVALGLPATEAIFIVAVGAAWLAWYGAPRPAIHDPGAHGSAYTEFDPASDTTTRSVTLLHPWRRAAFRRLLALFMVNGVASKLNLALAAGVALPALGWLGYQPGATDAQALQTLTLAYCVLPCLLKTLAAVLLYTLIIRKTP